MTPNNIKMEIARRTCFVNGERAMFHMWTIEQRIIEPSLSRGGHCGGQISTPVGIIELETGEVILVHPSSIRFADGGEFGDYIWFDDKEKV